MNLQTTLKHTILIVYFLIELIFPQGKVYLVLGSDTAIWDGMNTDRYHCYYNLDLFTSTSSNTAVVMSEEFRNQIEDSYGNKLKMTWWMIGGNMFRYATNNNVPIDNTMALHLMKQYYGDKIAIWGDELSLHYHTFIWSDYNGDGEFWWNQAQTFNETKEDFNYTLAQFLLEENIFPVSFRSGWHFMDNDWQNYLNEIIPYSLHNDYPAIHYDATEPTDNNYDWSQASSEFVPFHPSVNNYQLPGEGKGWNVRSKYMGNITQDLMNDVFQKAGQGIDQLVCLWSHLPDQNFLNEIQSVNNILHQAALNNPNVKFKYCSAVEAYELWRASNDTLKPELQLTGEINGPNINFLIKTNEPIFQKQPFVAIKDKYERYYIADCEHVIFNIWRTIDPFPISNLAKVGVAVTDTVGNLTTAFINYLDDDMFIDNKDLGFQELYGNWSTSDKSAWGLDSRYATLNSGDSAKVQWHWKSNYSGTYNIYVQFPEINNQVDTLKFELFKDNVSTGQKFLSPQNYNQWLYVNTLNLDAGNNVVLEMSAKNQTQLSKLIAADVIKVTEYVREKQLVSEKLFINLDDLSIEDSLSFELKINNAGIEPLLITEVGSVNKNIKSANPFPQSIEKMDNLTLTLNFIPAKLGFVEDTIIIKSDDPINPVYKIPFTVNVVNYFIVVDNDDSAGYKEEGVWYKSVVQAFGNSSRYANLQSTVNGPSASFTVNLMKNGIYDIYEIVPTTVNSANNALYVLSIANYPVDSLHFNQNEGSGAWKKIGRYYLPANIPITMKIKDSGESTEGPVIHADAIKFAIVEELTEINESENLAIPNVFELEQNYPNPFNPGTKIRYSLKERQFVTLKVYDVLGNEITTLVNEEKPSGVYETEFNSFTSSIKLASGIYFYKLQTGNFVKTKKMILLK